MANQLYRLALFALVLASLLLNTRAQADVARPLIVTSALSGVYGEILERLGECSAFAIDKRVISLSDAELTQASVRNADSIIAIGTRATAAVYELAPSVPVLSALITESGFEHLAARHYGSVAQALEAGVSAIYLDQPPARLYRLGMLLVPDAARVGVIATDPASASIVDHISGDKIPTPELEWVTLTDLAKPIKLLGPLMQRSAFVIALPGKREITLSAAKWILEIGSSTRTPVIAYSRKYATSGALAAVYTSPVDVADQVADVCSREQGFANVPAAVYPPKHFSVEINAAVARVLGIPVRDPGYYRDALMRAEGRP